MFNKRNMKENKPTKKSTKVAANSKIKEDEIAALVLALHEYFGGEHDVENTVLTFKQVGPSQSPWSSKILGMRQSK